MSQWVLIILSAALTSFTLPSYVNAYTWSIQQSPKQCGDMTVSVSGDGGKPPYRVLITPYGSPPWANTTEVRESFEQAFPGMDKEVTFKLKYPAQSQFVAVVSDASGFASGGTSIPIQVENSDDSSCFDASKQIVLFPWTFSTDPESRLVGCVNSRVYWNSNDNYLAKGTPKFQGIIPGGQSFDVPQNNSNITSIEGYGIGFDWKPSLRDGTTIILVGGDDRGNGTGGFMQFLVTQGNFPDRSCLNDNSPSSTPGTPAGGVATGAVHNGGPGTHGPNVGAIVGGVLGGVGFIIIALLLLWWWKRKQRQHQMRAPRQIWLEADDDAEQTGERRRSNFVAGSNSASTTGLTGQQLWNSNGSGPSRDSGWRSSDSGTTTPDPFILGVHPPTSNNSSRGDITSSTLSPTSTRRKGPLRPPEPSPVINIIQHQDAGTSRPSNAPPAQTIELPPAYASLGGRREQQPVGAPGRRPAPKGTGILNPSNGTS
ncbi:hypothetical protein CPB83DRAFT_809505 [Crepidotus variabilis]|uniref:Uncharacterized protein n=1 Tax=Crepidotus variabilis TaxID=179855 RepID=A0A9P6EM73_9AGAR|nr:hypothetical protein CPB83DRAFT_809505 [Crepidotus variabilis]